MLVFGCSPGVRPPGGGYRALETTWVNNGFKTNMTGIVILVIHSHVGQTAAISTAMLSLEAGAKGTAYPVAFGLASGEYSASIFVVTTGGTAISTTVVASFTV